MSNNIELIHTNCPRDCYDGCGMLVEKKEGTISRVLGDPAHPVSRGRLCNKCAIAYNGVWQDENSRLLYPKKRSGEKGSGKFERISWDEALNTIADRLKTSIANAGPQSIIHTHYSGTLSLIALLFPMRFFHRLGAAEVTPDTICNAAGHVAWNLLFGESYVGFDPRAVQDSQCMLLWGVNPSHSGPHSHKHWFAESNAKKIVVDPLRTKTALDADLHLQLLPGTDAALAFSILHALREKGLINEEFVATYTQGSEEITSIIDQCTPEWGEQQTGVSAELIRQAASWYGVGPSLLWVGQALQRQASGGNIMRAVGLLPAMTGNIGKPGAGFCYLNITPAIAGLDMDKMVGATLLGDDHLSISHMDLADELTKDDKFNVLFSWSTNPMASAPEQNKLKRALQRENLFTIVVDCFQTDTADYADIVLPASGMFEFDDLTFSYFHLNIGTQSKVREPMGESLPNQEIFRRLAKAMGFEQEELYERDETLIASMLKEMGVEKTFKQLQKTGWQPISEETIIFYDDLKFSTPSGKIEITSEKAVELGLPRAPLAGVDKKPLSGKLRLLTPASDLRLNDTYSNDPKLMKNGGAPNVYINPDDAKRFSVDDGERVRLFNDIGELELIAKIDNLTLSGVVVSYKGRWPKLEQDKKTVNNLHVARKADMGESTAVHSTEVHIQPMD